jgi:uncharacterized protein YkwD
MKKHLKIVVVLLCVGMLVFIPSYSQAKKKIKSRATLNSQQQVVNVIGIQLDTIEAKEAFEYLNKIRANPKIYSEEIGDNLDYIASKIALEWNPILASVAQEKAIDMANRNYFGHTDPDGYGMNYFINKAGYTLPEYQLQNKNANFYESISAIYDQKDLGKVIIKQLILDKGLKGRDNKGHRIHLLSIGDFRKNAKHIGIGIAKSSKSKYDVYCSVIII